MGSRLQRLDQLKSEDARRYFKKVSLVGCVVDPLYQGLTVLLPAPLRRSSSARGTAAVSHVRRAANSPHARTP